MNYKDELYHYGVLGQKWGIRRYQPYSVKPRGSGKGGKELGAAARYVARKTGTAAKYVTVKTGNAAKAVARKTGRALSTGAKKTGEFVTRPARNYITKKRNERKDRRVVNERKNTVRDMRALTDAEIQSQINRLKNEQELKRLIQKDIEPGKAFTNALMGDVGKKVLTTALTGAAMYGAKYLIDHDFDLSDFAKSVYRGGAPKK